MKWLQICEFLIEIISILFLNTTLFYNFILPVNKYLAINRGAGADPGFKVRGGAHLKKLRRAEEGAKIVGVFRVKNHDFTPKNHIFSNFRGGVRPPPGSAPGVLGVTVMVFT